MFYNERIQNIIEYIEANLCDEITIEDIAKRAFVSVPHLYKIFPYVTGCTVGTYIRQRRLTLAAKVLLSTDRRIVDVAVEHGFESQESFIRAFSQMFSITPGEYRKTRKVIALYPKLQLPERMKHVMQPKIITKKMTLVGMIVEIDVSQNFSTIFDELRQVMKMSFDKIGNKAEPFKRFGFWMPHYTHYCNYNESNSAKRLYFTGVEVTEIDSIPSELSVKVLPDSMFAVFRESERGTMARYAYQSWLPNSEYILNEDIMGDFEVYDEVDNYGESGECDVLIAIREAASIK